jgi:hypothetical protein
MRRSVSQKQTDRKDDHARSQNETSPRRLWVLCKPTVVAICWSIAIAAIAITAQP